MASMKRPRLLAVRTPGCYTLALTFADHRVLRVNLEDDIRHYPGLGPLQDATAFAGAVLGDGGWTVEWPALDIQIGADTLLLDALTQAASDPNTRTFLKWRAPTGLPLHAAAEALGVAPRTISRYSSGRTPVPRSLALACLGWQTPQAARLLAA